MDFVGGVADDAEDIGGSWLGAEVIHFIVEEEAGPFYDYATAEGPVDGVGVRYGISRGIDDGKVSGIRRFHRGERGADLRRRGGRRKPGADAVEGRDAV